MNSINLYEHTPNIPVRILEWEYPSGSFPLHWHENIEILYPLEGEMSIRCDENLLTMKEGTCIVINSNELHAASSGKCRYLCIQVPPSLLFKEKYTLFKNSIEDDFVNNTFKTINDLFKNKKETSLLSITGHTYLLFSHLLTYHLKNDMNTSYKIYVKKLHIANTAIKYMENHYSENITTQFLASRSYISESHFCHIFKEIIGKSAKNYLLDLRIEKSINLIKNTDTPISEISELCGFTDPNYFSRIFKKRKGYSPNAIRTHNKSK